MTRDDELDIEELLYRYADGVDRNDMATLEGVFTEDVTLDYGFGRVFEGRAQVLGLLADRLGTYAATSHHISNVTVHVSGEEARAASYVYAWHQRRVDDGQAQVWGRYDDLLRREAQGWRVSRRTIRAMGEQGFPPAEGRDTAFEPLSRKD